MDTHGTSGIAQGASQLANELASALIALLRTEGITLQNVCADSRQVKPGDIFLAYPGHQSDGRQHIQAAINHGASAVIWERKDFEWNTDWSLPNLPTDNLRWLAGFIAAEIFDNPSHKLWVIGVTGTNGKTSVSQWLSRALSNMGRRCGVIGTLGMGFPGQLETSANTTPDAIVLQRQLAGFVNKSAQAVAMEVSSIGLDQGRTNGCKIDVAVLTNLTRDHLDYHVTMEAYATAKGRLFEQENLKSIVLNFDDMMGVAMARRLYGSAVEVIGYTLIPDNATAAPASRVVVAENLKSTVEGLSFTVFYDNRRIDLSAGLVGQFNVSNLLAVISVLMQSGYSFEASVAAARELTPPEGRMQTVGGVGEPLIVVDYAHTPDALEQALLALRPTAQARNGSLICVFGCGGDRDPGKRPMMGEVATRLAEYVVITSDNPRTENPEKILEDIAVATPTALRIADRAEAIRQIVVQAGADDVILLAGKGHEAYQEVGKARLYFSDVEQARLALEAWNAHQEQDAS